MPKKMFWVYDPTVMEAEDAIEIEHWDEEEAAAKAAEKMDDEDGALTKQRTLLVQQSGKAGDGWTRVKVSAEMQAVYSADVERVDP